MVIRRGFSSSHDTVVVFDNADENLVYAELKKLIPTVTLKNELFFFTCKN